MTLSCNSDAWLGRYMIHGTVGVFQVGIFPHDISENQKHTEMSSDALQYGAVWRSRGCWEICILFFVTITPVLVCFTTIICCNQIIDLKTYFSMQLHLNKPCIQTQIHSIFKNTENHFWKHSCIVSLVNILDIALLDEFSKTALVSGHAYWNNAH